MIGLRKRHRVVQLCVMKDKSRTAIGWGCIVQSSVGVGKLGEVKAGWCKMEKSSEGKGKSMVNQQIIHFESSEHFLSFVSSF